MSINMGTQGLVSPDELPKPRRTARCDHADRLRNPCAARVKTGIPFVGGQIESRAWVEGSVRLWIELLKL